MLVSLKFIWASWCFEGSATVPGSVAAIFEQGGFKAPEHYDAGGDRHNRFEFNSSWLSNPYSRRVQLFAASIVLRHSSKNNGNHCVQTWTWQWFQIYGSGIGVQNLVFFPRIFSLVHTWKIVSSFDNQATIKETACTPQRTPTMVLKNYILMQNGNNSSALNSTSASLLTTLCGAISWWFELLPFRMSVPFTGLLIGSISIKTQFLWLRDSDWL